MSEPTNEDLYNHFLSQIVPHFLKINSIARYAEKDALQNHANPLVRCGRKVYSQNDEDGITFEILRRLGLRNGVFAEFGVEKGLENNTLALAALGWSGFWIGGDDLAFDFNPRNAKEVNFHYRKAWITKSNIVNLFRDELAEIRRSSCNLISIDLDGNDCHFVKELLESGIAPEVFIIEYNGKFIPPIEFNIEYDDEHRWIGDDYFGASLQTFFNLFKTHGYFLACCNLTGINAFFVKNKHKKLFKDIPDDIDQLYATPKYFLTSLDAAGHPVSTKTIELIMAKLNSD